MTKLLLIEDQEVDRKLAITRLKESPKFEIDTADTFYDAQVKLSANRYAAIILDLHIPGVEMDNAVKAIKKLALGAAIIVLSGYSDPKLIRKSLQDNACQFLVKGVHDSPPNALIGAVEVGIMTHAACMKLDEIRDDPGL